MPRLVAPASRPMSVPVDDRSPLWWFRWVPAALLTLLVLYLGYYVGRVAIIPVLASFAIAYVVNPIVEWFEARGLARAVAALLTLALVTVGMALFLWFVIPDLWAQSAKASDAVIRNLNETNARHVRQWMQDRIPLLDSIAGARLYTFLKSPAALTAAAQRFFTGGLGGIVATAANVFDLLIIPFFVYYILIDFDHWRQNFDELLPSRFREPFSRLFDEVGRILQSYVLGQLMIAMLMGAMYAVGFALLRVPAWAGLAALSGFLNVIPYVGTGSGLILASGFVFADTGQLWRVFGVIGVFGVVQSVEGYYLTPRILGGRLSLHPMAVFLGLLIAGRLFGLLGILLAVPTIAVMSVFLKFLREIYRASDVYRAGEIGPEAAPRPVEEVLSQAADTVLADQVSKQEGDEVLAPTKAEDDPVAARKP
jgi:predicted PurR-regulated permease PerM